MEGWPVALYNWVYGINSVIALPQLIFVTVQGGIAEVCEETLPLGVVVEILDFDNLAADEENEMACRSPKLREYWAKNHKNWDRCEEGCPCGVEWPQTGGSPLSHRNR